MLTNMKKELLNAYKNKQAIPQFNINNLEWTKFILEECQKYNYQYVDTAAGNKRDLILEELLRKITEKNS